jgi:glycerol-3-phosphate dehydrogenase (NAD(P)+)
MKQITILGSGGMGTALALLFDRAGLAVRLWSHSAERAGEMARSRTNERHLPGIAIPEPIAILESVEEAVRGADLIVAAVPSAFLRGVLEGLAKRIPAGVPFLSVVKGIENETFRRPSQIIVESLGTRPVAILSGPSHAEELARSLPASVVVAGGSEELNVAVQETLGHEAFRVYTNPDAIGVELAGALKNIMGIAAGICDGLDLGDNAKAALLTRGLVEITRLGVALGGHQSTFYGLAGVGDLITTCYSPYGRNRAVGERIGRGEGVEDILRGMVNVAEGVPTTRSVHALARTMEVPMPITAELHQVLFAGKDPRAVVYDLMLRLPKVEWDA